MQLVTEGLNIAQTQVFRLEHGLIGHIEVEETLLSQVITSQLLGILLEYFGQKCDKLLGLVPVAGEKVRKSDYALLLVPETLGVLPQVLLPLVR